MLDPILGALKGLGEEEEVCNRHLKCSRNKGFQNQENYSTPGWLRWFTASVVSETCSEVRVGLCQGTRV